MGPEADPVVRPAFTVAAAARMERWLLSAYPREGTAVGLGAHGRVKVWVRIPNRDSRPGRFAMDEAALITALRRGRCGGLEPLVFVHSHPDGGASLSARDRRSMRYGDHPLWPGTWWWVRPVRRGKVEPGRFHPCDAPGFGPAEGGCRVRRC